MTKPKPDAELADLVYGLTPIPHEEQVSLFQPPGFLGGGCGRCVCHLANHFLVGGNDEIRRIAVDLVLHRHISAVNGAIIFARGIYELMSPPEHQVVLYNLHANVWWGAVLLILGLFFSLRFSPARERARWQAQVMP